MEKPCWVTGQRTVDISAGWLYLGKSDCNVKTAAGGRQTASLVLILTSSAVATSCRDGFCIASREGEDVRSEDVW